MDSAALMTFFVASLILMIKPGPYMMTFISLSLEGRWKSMLSFWSGYLIVRTAAYYVLLSSLSLLPEGLGFAFIFIKAVAALLFVSMGVSGLQASMAAYSEAAARQTEEISRKSLLSVFFTGGVLCLSNPYDLVFILAVIPALFGTTQFSIQDIHIINAVYISADVIVQLSYILPLMYIRNFMSPDLMRRIKIGTSLALIGIGLYILVNIFLRWDLTRTNLIQAALF